MGTCPDKPVGDGEFSGGREEGRPVALQEVAAPDLHGRAVHLQQAPQEGLLVEVVPPHKHQRPPVRQALRDGAVANLPYQRI